MINMISLKQLTEHTMLIVSARSSEDRIMKQYHQDSLAETIAGRWTFTMKVFRN